MNTNLPTISIVFPCRSRAWVLPHFLKCILDLDYPKHLISILSYVNDSNDDTELILNDFKNKYEKEYNKIYIKKYNLNTPTYDHNARGGTIISNIPQPNGMVKMVTKNNAELVYKSLSKLRNLLLIKTDTDYVFSVDTDIMFKPDILHKLLNYKVDFISALICNGHMAGTTDEKINPYWFTNIMRLEDEYYTHVQEYEGEELLEVDLTGAISLMSRAVVKSGAKYYNISKMRNHIPVNYGEDSGFCFDVQQKGFKIYNAPQIKCTHIMTPDFLEPYLKGEFTF